MDFDSDFVARHIGIREDDLADMLDAVGVASIEVLLKESLPSEIYDKVPLELPPAQSEPAVLERLRQIAQKNELSTSLIGQGYYDSYLPPVILRNVLENPAWYSAYTPYQPEISQGRLELLLAFQTMVIDLTEMEIANASLLDEATAVAESMTLLARVNDSSNKLCFGVDVGTYPQTYAVLKGRAAAVGIELVDVSPEDMTAARDCFGVFFQLETTEGKLQDLESAIKTVHKQNCLVSVAADPLALCLVKPPKTADVIVGTTQRFGIPLGYGGPHAAYIATKESYRRALPGRLVGVSKDTTGQTAYRLALQTREQHIRKQRATSNICTAQVLLAVISALYGIYHGPKGLTKIARHTHNSALKFTHYLKALGLLVKHDSFFGTVTFYVPDTPSIPDTIEETITAILKSARAQKINLHQISSTELSAAFDETSTDESLQTLMASMAGALGKSIPLLDEISDSKGSVISKDLARTTPPLQNKVFMQEWSETDFVRYITRLAKKDLTLDHSMIPLGSCTMKLNSATELTPISWREFSGIHPFAPAKQTAGYTELLDELSAHLIEITGMDVASLQPNAGSQGELAGLLAIRQFHIKNGDSIRNICIIPASAHGTNSASAVMAGMEVVILGCDENGNVDLADLKTKIATHKDKIAALMITYPSTHGIFESEIKQICDLVHSVNGQVYMDGANLNALIGLARPGDFGVDVAHLNLHKTFCIPHGGGGPGVGPIVAKQHLAPYMPGHPYAKELKDSPPVSAAPFGSAGILPISWAYIALMGAEGLQQATQYAILSANYLASMLNPHFPVLYTGQNNRVAHECVLDFRAFRDLVSVEDVAKRLMDYGFHSPTISFPVPDTMMVEPTESESKQELDKFIMAMGSIRQEIAKIQSGEWGLKDNPLKNAPHTIRAVTVESWKHPYSREVAAFPLPYLHESKYWPPVGRIDSVWGDRNLFCSCPS